MKEKIIDNINVAECLFISKKENLCYCYLEDDAAYCKDHKNCYYKQLQRLDIVHKNTIKEYKKEIKELKDDKKFLKQTLEACEKEHRRILEEMKNE